MVLYNAPNFSNGLDRIVTDTANSVPALPIMLLIFTYGVIFLGGSNNQKARLGRADYPFWAVLGGISITLEALLMTLGTGLIDITVLGIVIAITVMSGLWFFLSKSRGEI